MHHNNSNSSDSQESGGSLTFWLVGFLVGIFGGATVALLTAPKSGNEVRGVLKKTAKDVPSRLTEILDDSLDLYASAVNYFQLVVEEQAQRMKKAVAAGKLAAAKKREELELGGSSVLPFQHR
jgi:gas vesicle protein